MASQIRGILAFGRLGDGVICLGRRGLAGTRHEDAATTSQAQHFAKPSPRFSLRLRPAQTTGPALQILLSRPSSEGHSSARPNRPPIATSLLDPELAGSLCLGAPIRRACVEALWFHVSTRALSSLPSSRPLGTWSGSGSPHAGRTLVCRYFGLHGPDGRTGCVRAKGGRRRLRGSSVGPSVRPFEPSAAR